MTAAGHSNVKPIIVQGHSRPLTMVKYNREGDLLFTAAKDHRPCVWYADNGERIGTFDGHQGTVWALDVNFASTHLLTAGADNNVKLWNVQTGECLHTWKHTAPVRDVRFAMGDKAFLTVLDNIMGNVPTIFVWPLELDNLANHPDCPDTTILGHTSKVTRALWGALNRSIFSGSPTRRSPERFVTSVHASREMLTPARPASRSLSRASTPASLSPVKPLTPDQREIAYLEGA